MGTRKVLYWLARPYEGDAWKRTDIPPSDETRRYCEFMPVYNDTPHAETVTLDTDRFATDFASIFGGRPMADLPGATRKIGKKVDHSGRRVGMLVAITPATNAPNRGARWHCRCDCGSEAIVPAESLVRGKSRSCGCSSNKFRSEKLTRHGQSRSVNGGSGSYRSWHAARQRCVNSKSRYFANYGGRGIQFCERWALFDNFFADMGPRPEGYTLDRIDPNGNYEPGNCKWSTPREQSLNQRPKVRNDDISDLLSVAKRILAAGTPFRSELSAAIDKVELRRMA